MKISDDQYRAFVLGVFGEQPIAPNGLHWLGQSSAYADPWVIEIALPGTPLRFSFKFRKSDSLSCCINLRPYADELGKAGSQKHKTDFEKWIAKHYDDDPKAKDGAPYFKPYGQLPVRTKTVDTYFQIRAISESDLCLTKPSAVKTCPELPHIANNVTLQLTLAEAVQRVLLRAQN